MPLRACECVAVGAIRLYTNLHVHRLNPAYFSRMQDFPRIFALLHFFCGLNRTFSRYVLTALFCPRPPRAPLCKGCGHGGLLLVGSSPSLAVFARLLACYYLYRHFHRPHLQEMKGPRGRRTDDVLKKERQKGTWNVGFAMR